MVWELRMACAVAVLMATGSLAAAEQSAPLRQYTYAWMFTDDGEMAPRGGTTKGPGVVLDQEPGDAWRSLAEPGISKQERDRRAILAMAGGYRTSFDFIETHGFSADYRPKSPYQSWGTEYVYVVEDRPDFVSLQHIIVMFFVMEGGEISEPAVVKHWRQDWHYEDSDLHVYVGHNTWKRRTYSPDEVAGTWSQSVYQVDDSPRYQAIGRWTHDGNFSSWESENTWRPLPRREFSVRDDYHVLTGTNRHTITPTGWVHEEDNLKLVLDEDGTPRDAAPYLAREAGFNRYERIVDHDFSAGDDYWEKTTPYWADVRAAWEDIFAEQETVTLEKDVDGQSMFMALFTQAAALQSPGDYDPVEGRQQIDKTLAAYMQ